MQSFQNKNSRDEYVWLEECRRWPGSRRLAASFHFSVQFCKNLHSASDRTVKPTIFTWLPLLSQIICIGGHPFHFSPSFFICLHFCHPFSFHCLLKGNCKDHKGNKHHLSRKVWEVTRKVFQWIANVPSLQKEAAFTFFPCSKLMHY